MANIEELKITEDKTRGKHVADLPTNPSESLIDAQTLQNQFDALPELVIEALNTLIDYLVANGLGEATHNIKTYNALSQLGLTHQTATVNNIFNAMPNYSKAQFTVTSGWLDDEYPGGKLGILKVEKYNSTRAVFEQVVNNTSYKGLYDGSFKGWKEPLLADGSVPMTGSLVVDKGTQYSAVSVQRIVNDILGKAGIGVASKDEKPVAQVVYHKDNVETARLQFDNTFIRLADVIGGKAYMLFGEHNKELLSGEGVFLPFSDGFTVSQQGGYWKDADETVFMNIGVRGSNGCFGSQQSVQVGTLPAGFRPHTHVVCTCAFAGSTAVDIALGAVDVYSDGRIVVVNPTSSDRTFAFFSIAFKAYN